jgi:hypothetical protein
LKTSSITLRFIFNRNAGTVSRARYANAASRFVAKNVAMNVADERWQILRERVQKRVSADVTREMAHLAQEYRRLIIGISDNNEGPRGTLKTVTEPAHGGTSFASYNLHIAWDERSRDYLARKRREKGQTRWFEYDRVLARTMGKSSTWFGAFGPVEVQVTRKSMSQEAALDAGFNDRFDVGGGGGKSIRVQIGTIRVFAMRSITPQMLPALASGNIDDMAPDGTKTGLIGRFPGDIAVGLAPNRRFVPYRHSVEPFLGFFLTRAIPNAVLRRLEENLHTDISRQGGATNVRGL